MMTDERLTTQQLRERCMRYIHCRERGERQLSVRGWRIDSSTQARRRSTRVLNSWRAKLAICISHAIHVSINDQIKVGIRQALSVHAGGC